ASRSSVTRGGTCTMDTLTSGLDGVIVASTRLSHVDGERGELLIRGVPVQELAPCASFEDTLFLLWNGRRPSPHESRRLRHAMAARRAIPAETGALLRAAAERHAPAMDALRMAAGTLSLVDARTEDASREANLGRAIDLVARFPTIVAAYARLRRGQ